MINKIILEMFFLFAQKTVTVTITDWTVSITHQDADYEWVKTHEDVMKTDNDELYASFVTVFPELQDRDAFNKAIEKSIVLGDQF